jgi:PKD repeat protein/endonuclease/exonuclease/phosphatase family metal-dependent hydrolase
MLFLQKIIWLMRKVLQIAFFLIQCHVLFAQTDNLKVMYYNILDYPNNDPGREVYFRTINQYVQADVIAVTELKSSTGATTLLNQALNVYGTTYYQKAVYYTGTYSENLLYYNSEKLALYSQDVIYTSLRDINEYVLYYKSADLGTTGDTIFFYFYIAHLKASQGYEQDRLAEVNQFLAHLNSLPNTENVFFGGDFNLYTSTEPAYQALINNTPYSLNDPLPAGNWHASGTYSLIHTQSTRTADFGGGSTGGMDDRFDFILFTDDVLAGTNKVQYVTNSCKAFGNDGNHFNKALIDPPVNPNVPDSVIQALYYMSDHLPVICDLTVTATVDTTQANLVITEIYYNPPEIGTDSLEFIEIYNNGTHAVNLSNFKLSNAVDYTFGNVSLNPSEYIIIAYNPSAMLNTFGVNTLQWSGGLNNDGELILLKDNSEKTVDSVWFDDAAPWPTTPDGTGPSLMLCDPNADNSIGSNWQASQHFVMNNGGGMPIYATPGFTECVYPPVADFAANLTAISAGESVTFTDLSTNNPTSWSWTFAGGTPANSALQNPFITYNTAGVYDVQLIATNSSGSNTILKTGYITVTEPFSGTLMITEVMQNPYSVPDAAGEWFEVYNPTAAPVNMNGWTIRDDGTDSHIITGNLIVPAGGFAVLGINSNSSVNGGYTCNYQYSTFFLGNSGDEIILVDPSNNEIDRIEYDGGPTWPDPNGASMVFTGTPSADNNISTNWTTATVRELSYTGTTGDKGSPGTNGTGQNLVSPAFDLNLKVYLEGPFNGSGMTASLGGLVDFPLSQPYSGTPWGYDGTEAILSLPNPDVVDWVLVELRDATDIASATEATVISRRAAFVMTSGAITDTDGTSLLHYTTTVTNQLFVVVYHRNHIAVISANALIKVGGVYTYDFTTGVGQVYGGTLGHKQLVTGKWGMFAGDADASGLVNSADKTSFWNLQAAKRGYLKSDLNMDTQANNKDKNDYWRPNQGAGSQVP